MLSKTVKQINNHYLANGSSTETPQSDFKATSDVTGTGTLDFYVNYNSRTYYILYVEHNGETINYGKKTATYNFSFSNVTLYNWDKVTLSGETGFISPVNYSIKFSYKEMPNSKIIKAYEIMNIWEKTNCYLFGMLPNGEWRDGN